MRSTLLSAPALFALIALTACSQGPAAREPSPAANAGPLAACCAVVPGRFRQTESGLLADVVRTPEEAAGLNAAIAGLRAANSACELELAAEDRDPAAALARVKQAALPFDLGAGVPECK